MGPNGFGRHLSVALLYEKIATTGLLLYLSYDSGHTWEAQRRFLNSAAIGGVLAGPSARVQWVPKRRKICGVRAKVVMVPDTAATANAGAALLRLTMVFDEMIGPVRLQMQERGSRQT
jgi:hypothetical protein